MPAFGRKKADATLIIALAGGDSLAAAARKAGVSVSTVYRRIEDETFLLVVEEARSALVKRSIGRLSALGSKAVGTLRALLTAQSEAVRLGAARAALEFLLRGNEQVAIIQRVEALERRARREKR